MQHLLWMMDDVGEEQQVDAAIITVILLSHQKPITGYTETRLKVWVCNFPGIELVYLVGSYDTPRYPPAQTATVHSDTFLDDAS